MKTNQTTASTTATLTARLRELNARRVATVSALLSSAKAGAEFDAYMAVRNADLN
jgi:hypothetical protein